ncbi:MAG: iron-containing alcohol dehydrogenase [Rubrobacter sp.]|nr:iron-containing alcohol dehydrogenase [Rubrobacter sp.]
MDTAKAANLIATHPASIIEYIYPPVGSGRKPPSPLKPLLAIPTTADTGSEATGIVALDLPDLKTKAAISHPFLWPDHGIVDPLLIRSMPPDVTAACRLDVVCHAAESFTVRPYKSRLDVDTLKDFTLDTYNLYDVLDLAVISAWATPRSEMTITRLAPSRFISHPSSLQAPGPNVIGVVSSLKVLSRSEVTFSITTGSSLP